MSYTAAKIFFILLRPAAYPQCLYTRIPPIITYRSTPSAFRLFSWPSITSFICRATTDSFAAPQSIVLAANRKFSHIVRDEKQLSHVLFSSSQSITVIIVAATVTRKARDYQSRWRTLNETLHSSATRFRVLFSTHELRVIFLWTTPILEHHS